MKPIFLLLGLWAFTAVASESYETYVNERYGFRIEYPANFTPHGVSDSGDGQIFSSLTNDAELRVFASACIEGQNATEAEFIATYQREQRSGSRKVTYKKAMKNSAVVSGLKGARVFYNKLLIDNGWCTQFNFEYDANKNEQYRPVTKVIASSFHN